MVCNSCQSRLILNIFFLGKAGDYDIQCVDGTKRVASIRCCALLEILPTTTTQTVTSTQTTTSVTESTVTQDLRSLTNCADGIGFYEDLGMRADKYHENMTQRTELLLKNSKISLKSCLVLCASNVSCMAAQYR